ncbi:MAG: hypothetical protein J0I98_15100 [Mesorhizobium sp.]|nr:hypothetical protein [Mesorhizobium sp.]MBN9244116.1 hypothetical protein [Mesorhizobium sp.]
MEKDNPILFFFCFGDFAAYVSTDFASIRDGRPQQRFADTAVMAERRA